MKPRLEILPKLPTATRNLLTKQALAVEEIPIVPLLSPTI